MRLHQVYACCTAALLALWAFVPGVWVAASVCAACAVVAKVAFVEGYRAAETDRVRRELARRMASNDLVD